jgi:hypothetical protein
MVTASTRPTLRNEQGKRSLELGAAGQLDAVSFGLLHELCQPIGGQRLT